MSNDKSTNSSSEKTTPEIADLTTNIYNVLKAQTDASIAAREAEIEKEIDDEVLKFFEQEYQKSLNDVEKAPKIERRTFTEYLKTEETQLQEDPVEFETEGFDTSRDLIRHPLRLYEGELSDDVIPAGGLLPPPETLQELRKYEGEISGYSVPLGGFPESDDKCEVIDEESD